MTQLKPRALVIGNYRGRTGIINALRGTEFGIIEATEGCRGIKHVLEDAPSVVIISAGVTRDDAISLLRAIRCLTSAPIVLVGSGRESDSSLALRHGVDAFVPQSRHLEITSVYVKTLLSRN